MKQFNIYTPFSVVTKSTDSEKPMEGIRIAGYANTTDKDRGGDIVLTSAWAKGIDNFKKNPVLLLQHNHNQPIGRVETLKIDNKGLYVEAYISPAAEKQYSTITLIDDSVLKSFSVGFVPKKIKQPMDNTTNNIVSELELLEISVVAVPMNQNSLFSIKKSFNSESEYTSYLKNDVEVEKTINISTKTSLMASGHYHIFEIGENDSGISVYASHGQKHVHKLINGQVEEVNGHSHELAISEIEPKEIEISLSSTDTLIDKEEPVIESVKEVPKELIFNDPNVKYITENTFVRLKNKRYKTINIATPENPTFKFLQVDLNGVSNDNSVIEIKSDDLSVIDAWNIGTTYDLRISDLQLSNDLTEEIKNIISQNYDDLIKVSEIELYKVKTSNQQQQQLINKLLNLKSTPRNEWATNEYRFAEYLTAMVKELITLEDSEDRNLALALHGYDLEIKKENIQMTTQPTQPAGDVLVVPSTKGSAEAPAGSVSVAEPRVAELVEKTGAAIMAEADAQDKQVLVKNVEVPYTPRESEELAELKAQVNKYKDQIASLQNTKMQFQESNRNTTRFTSKELNDAFLLSKALNVGVYETNLGAKMKAVTTVDQFLSNFSTSVYEEMQQQLVVAPMFRRLAVDARNFRIPVSDEDTNGDVGP